MELQPKEVAHLIQGGALDGLGDSRAGLLTEWAGLGSGGSARQLALPFEQPVIPAEIPAQRLAWERFVLGLPVSLTPLAAVTDLPGRTTPLADLVDHPGQVVTVVGYRLPGWTGGAGFYLGDGQSFVVAWGSETLRTPPTWQPVAIQGRWRQDAFGTGWLQVDRLAKLETGAPG